MAYNGASIVAMKGNNCVVIASDRRFGVQGLTISCDYQKLFKVHDRLIYGLAGLGTDVQTLSERFRFKTNMYKLREERLIEPKTFMHMVSSTLYEKRFGPYFVEPVVAGLDSLGVPFIASTDLIGCINFAKDFAVAGTASENLYGMCETVWRENMDPEELFEATAQALLNAVDRDCMSGWGAVVHILYGFFSFQRPILIGTPDRIVTRTLQGRMD